MGRSLPAEGPVACVGTQDAVIKSTVVRTEPQVQPWIVYTCGPMGAGKGYTLSWMSRHGFFPLENIVHIDPDHFKSCMVSARYMWSMLHVLSSS